MKRIYNQIMGMLVLLLIGDVAVAQNLISNGDFETSSPEIDMNYEPGQEEIINNIPDWFVSHGSPDIYYEDDNVTIHMHSQFISSLRTEGLYLNYSFEEGESYVLTYDLLRTEAFAPTKNFFIQLANGLPVDDGTGAGGVTFDVPIPTENEVIHSVPWENIGEWETISFVFTPSTDYDHMWVYPVSLTGDLARCEVDNFGLFKLDSEACNFTPTFNLNIGTCERIFENATIAPSALGFEILKTEWNFGDGTTAEGDLVHHYYENFGTYEVCMTVWMTNGTECCKKTICQTVKVGKLCDPCQRLDEISIEHLADGGTFNFSTITPFPGLSSNFGYRWEFGDGELASGESAEHVYTASGTYAVYLTTFYYDAEGNECCKNRVLYEIEVVL